MRFKPRPQLSLFWPVIQGGWMPCVGHLVALDDALAILATLHGTKFDTHPDLIHAEDTQDLLDFLDERLTELALPAPLQIVTAGVDGKGTRGLAPALHGTRFLLWSEDSWRTCPPLQAAMDAPQAKQATRFELRHPRILAPGIAALGWVLILAAMIAVVLRPLWPW